MKNLINIPEYRVSEFNNHLKEVLNSTYDYIKIRGEISSVQKGRIGQIFITLKDENSILNGIIWKNNMNNIAFNPEVGVEVIAVGKITTYAKSISTYQIDIENLEIAGEGALLKLVEQRKKKLAEKGYFDEKYKKKLPYIPNKIGVITSPTGAVIHDIINRIKDRFPVSVELWPTAVQGNEASKMIIDAINGFNSKDYPDKPEVIIIARGGGSVEDLMPFNDEDLVISVYKSKIPIVSAIGHETDYTLLDYVSDLRTPTPTAAAEKTVPVQDELISKINILTDRLTSNITRLVIQNKDLINNYSKLLKSPKFIINSFKEKMINSGLQLNSVFKSLFEKNNYILVEQKNKLKSPNDLFKYKKLQSLNLFKNLESKLIIKVENKLSVFNNLIKLLQANSLEKNLSKGYTVLKKSNKIVKESNNLKNNDRINIKFIDKDINVIIKKT